MKTTRIIAIAMLIAGSGLALHLTAQTMTISGTESPAVAAASPARHSAQDASIRPFTVHFPQAALDNLRKRIAATQWPQRETIPDDSQGVPLATWTERAYPKLIYYKKHDKGGHFAAWEQPQLLSEDVRAGFRSLRT